MPVIDREDARDVDDLLGSALASPGASDTVTALRSLFVEKLDFNGASGSIPLADDSLRVDARRIATREGIHVVAVQFPHADRLRTREIRTALKSLGQTLNGEILLAATDAARSQIDFVYPDL
jgi:hypothetical protein